jgi:hypothetical protein
MPSPVPPADRPRWTSAQYSYLALGLNGGCLIVLFANLLTRNEFWQVAIGLLVLGGLSAFQARRLRAKERRDL